VGGENGWGDQDKAVEAVRIRVRFWWEKRVLVGESQLSDGWFNWLFKEKGYRLGFMWTGVRNLELSTVIFPIEELPRRLPRNSSVHAYCRIALILWSPQRVCHLHPTV
jgi:hypothetical protein